MNVSYKSKKLEAIQAVKITGLKELFMKKQNLSFPMFGADDPNDDALFSLSLHFNDFSEEEWMGYWIKNKSERHIYVQSYCISLLDPKSVVLQSRESASIWFQSNTAFKRPKFYSYESFKKILEKYPEFSEFTVKCRVVFGSRFRCLENDGDPGGSNTVDREPPEEDGSATLVEDLQNLYKSKKFSDVTFHVKLENDKEDTEEAEIKAHKNILAARCPYFDTMFSTGLKESTTGTIEVTDVDVTTFQHLLSFIYSGRLSADLSFSESASLLQVSDQYLMPELKRRCAAALERTLTPDNVQTYLVYACLFNCPDLKRACFKLMTTEMTEASRLRVLGDTRLRSDVLLEMSEYLSQEKS